MLFNKNIKILAKYLDFLNIFSKDKTLVLPDSTKLNQYTIKLQEDKQLFYKSIYSLGLIEPKTLKIYIKTNLDNGFI